MKSYDVFSRSYLQRARARLDEKTTEALFYAAFELRCGIEVRMQEYLEAQEHLSKSQKRGWQIAKLGRKIEQAFRLGDRIIQITFIDPKTNNVVYSLIYTPVTSALQRDAEKLGNYMHALSESPTGEKLIAMRAFLERVYIQLELANKGKLLGRPLVKSDGRWQLYIEDESVTAEINKLDPNTRLSAKFLDELPS
jgi:hypothetical protein